MQKAPSPIFSYYKIILLMHYSLVYICTMYNVHVVVLHCSKKQNQQTSYLT